MTSSELAALAHIFKFNNDVEDLRSKSCSFLILCRRARKKALPDMVMYIVCTHKDIPVEDRNCEKPS
jgi:hypothetical protein